MKSLKYVFISIMIVLVMVSTSFASDILTSDIENEDIKEAVVKLNALGIINGMEDGKYHPQNPVTREQLAKILVVTLGLGDTAVSNVETQFSDVDKSRWSAGYINVAVEKGLVKGYTDGTFGPSKPVSYAEALTMIARTLGYSDEDLVGEWPNNYIEKTAELNITENITFEARDIANRGSVALMIKNALEVQIEK